MKKMIGMALGFVFVVLAGAVLAAETVAPVAGSTDVFGFLFGIRDAVGATAITALVAKFLTGWLRNVDFVKRLPFWLSGSREGKPMEGWRIYALVGLVSVVLLVAKTFLPGSDAFDLKSLAAWKQTVKAVAFAVFGNEVLRTTFQGNTQNN